jgi:hypothetical protein
MGNRLRKNIMSLKIMESQTGREKGGLSKFRL